MSASIALRRSPKPGALTATAVNVPRILLTTRVDSASPSTSSAMISSGLPAWTTFSSSGSSSLTEEILPWLMQDVGVVEDGFHPLRVGDHVRRDVALVELHAFGELELDAHRLGLFDGDDAVLADLAERLGDELADRGVLRGDRRRRWRPRPGRRPRGRSSSSLSLIASTAASMPRFSAERLSAGRDVAQTLADHRLGQDGRGRRAVTGDVVGLGRDLLGELRPEVLVRVVELDLLGDGHAVVGDRRRAPLLVDHDVAALGPEGDLDDVGEGVDAALQRSRGRRCGTRESSAWLAL